MRCSGLYYLIFHNVFSHKLQAVSFRLTGLLVQTFQRLGCGRNQISSFALSLFEIEFARIGGQEQQEGTAVLARREEGAGRSKL